MRSVTQSPMQSPKRSLVRTARAHAIVVWLAVTTASPNVWASELPDPNCSEVVPWDGLNGAFLNPSSPIPIDASIARIVVLGFECQPIVGASVSVEFTPVNAACPSAVLSGTTDDQGRVTIVAEGGGCFEGFFACAIKANGVTIRAYESAKSPDFDGSGGDGAVGLADLVTFSSAFLGNSPGCHDYDNDGATGLSDLILFGQAFVSASQCP